MVLPDLLICVYSNPKQQLVSSVDWFAKETTHYARIRSDISNHSAVFMLYVRVDLDVCTCWLQALLQDVLSHARMLESTLEKAQSLRHSGVGDQAALSMFISQSKEHYQSLIDRAKVYHFFF